ncbi:IucA/IucC family C-terminal-domain containing protein [Streptomyces sp. NPDC006655]|uniref:(2Fe-2S)-binding protein n=1 Tax=Streptomyces sp. NPDC006655 TaxID=3156898 RepID=UPI00345431D7
MDLDPDLAALRPLGGFFVLRTVPAATAGTAAARTDALPTLARAYAGAHDGAHDGNCAGARAGACEKAGPDGRRDPLTHRVGTVRERLRAPEPRVAASIAHQALAARLWSVALGCAARYGRLPDLDPRLLRWDTDATAPDDLWLTEVRALPGGAEPATLVDAVVHGHLEPLAAALRARHGVAAGLLWGNAGSALAGAARELDRRARADGDAHLARRARALTAALFAHPRLRPTGTRTGLSFHRRSCCLYYRVPGGGICGDCCFTQPPRPSARAASG